MDFFEKYPNKIPLLLRPHGKLEQKITKRKYMVPKDYNVGQFLAILRSKYSLKKSESVFIFVDGVLPMITETFGQLLERQIPSVNFEYENRTNIIILDMRCENTFGAPNQDNSTTVELTVEPISSSKPPPLPPMNSYASTPSLQMVVDCRETDLIECMSCEYAVEQLPVGDIVIRSSPYSVGSGSGGGSGGGSGDAYTDVDGNTLTHRTLNHYVFERKTMRDLRASIRDGRWREQKNRLLKWFPRESVVYIIENFDGYNGMTMDPWTKVNGSSQISGILNTMFRDGLKVVCTKSLEDTGRFLQEFFQRCPDYISLMTQNGMGGGEGTGQRSLPSVDMLKTGAVRKNQITPMNIFQLQMTQIPGVSTKISEAVKRRYPRGFIDLFEHFQRLEEPDTERKKTAFVNILKEIPLNADIPVNNGRSSRNHVSTSSSRMTSRKLGIKTAQNIVDYLVY